MGRAFEATTGMSKVPGDAGTRAPVLVTLRAPLVTSRSQCFHRPLFQKLHFTAARPPNSQEGEARRRGPPSPSRHSGLRPPARREQCGHTSRSAGLLLRLHRNIRRNPPQIAQQLKLLVLGHTATFSLHRFIMLGSLLFLLVTQKSTLD